MWTYNYNDTLSHHGIKGMKWGVRRYQNSDGSLTAAGRKRYAKEYEKTVKKVNALAARTNNKRYLDSYNEAAEYANTEGISKFNARQEKKYGKNYSTRNSYESDYADWFNTEVAKRYDSKLIDLYKNDKNYKKCQELVNKYKMTEWNDLAKENKAIIDDLMDMGKYDDKTSSKKSRHQ